MMMALPDYSGGNGFYDPTNPYIGQNNAPLPAGGYNYYGTELDPQAVYNTKLTQMGMGGLGGRARTAQALFPKFQQGYGQAKLNKNFELFFPEYLDQVNIGRVMGSLSQEAQGLEPGRYQGRYRWGMRG
jgi:hypothetical protein